MANKIRSAPLDPEITDRLLDLLSTDDAYRARFEADPRRALFEIGYESPAPAKITACGSLPEPIPEALIDCRVEDLAPKESIAAARSEIRAMLTRGLSQQSPQLDTGLKTTRQRLK